MPDGDPELAPEPVVVSEPEPDVPEFVKESVELGLRAERVVYVDTAELT